MIQHNNQVLLTGRVGQEPELHYLTDGTPVVRTRLYLSPRTGTAGREEPNDCFRIVAWHRLAEQFCRQARRGGWVSVQGSLRNRHFVRDGQTHVRTEIHLSHFHCIARARPQVPGDGQVAMTTNS